MPQLSAVQLNEHVQELSGLLMQPWFTIKRFELLRQEVEGLVGAMHKYCEYLRGNEYAPEDRYSRRNWLAKLALPYPTCMYCYAYGNSMGTLTYIWKIPEGPLDQTAVSRVGSRI